MKSRKKIGKPDVRFRAEVEPSVHRIVRLGLEHIKAGKSLGRLCICTSDQNGETFFIGLKETGAAVCPLCGTRHRIVNFKTAVSNAYLNDLKYSCYGIDPMVLIESLLGTKGPGIVAKRGKMMRDLQAANSAAVAGAMVINGKFGSAPKASAS